MGNQVSFGYSGTGLPPRATARSGAINPSGIPSYLRPSEAFIPPAGGVFFGQTIKSPSIGHFLLAVGINKQVGDYLMQRYFDVAHPVARCVHWPSFQAQYADFWGHIEHNSEPRASTQALVFAAWFTAAVSLTDGQVEAQFNSKKMDLVQRMQLGIETAL